MTLLRHFIGSTFSFQSYPEITFQSPRKSLVYFFGLTLLTALCIFPFKLYPQSAALFAPVLEEIAERFPVLEFHENIHWGFLVQLKSLNPKTLAQYRAIKFPHESNNNNMKDEHHQTKCQIS